MHCINTDYSGFCSCEKVATPTLYFMGEAKKIIFFYFWHSKNIYFHSYKCTFNQQEQSMQQHLFLDPGPSP